MKEELGNTVDEILKEDTLTSDVEKGLFKEAMLLQQKTLDRTPSSYQIKQSFKRWKRERGIDKDAEGVFNEVDIYNGKRA